ncbi:unnamed protein product [Camellia sinensis]
MVINKKKQRKLRHSLSGFPITTTDDRSHSNDSISISKSKYEDRRSFSEPTNFFFNNLTSKMSHPLSVDRIGSKFWEVVCDEHGIDPTGSITNAAVAVNSKLQYAVVEVHALLGDASMSPGDRKKRLGNVLKEQNKPFLIIASDLLSTLEAKWGTKLVVKKILMEYIHPIDSRECPVIIGGDYITTESGTGLYGLPIHSPVDDDGKFSGLDVLGGGNCAVIEYLDEHMSIIMEHKYPYDWWRTKKPTIFRATEQWFAFVEGFREAAMDAISQVTFLSQAENRIPAMTSSHSDRCISRQRTWGVPIPVFYHVESKEPLLNENPIDHIQSIICQKGSDAWWYMTVDELLPDVYRDKASEYEKGTVQWMLGSSWAAVLEKRSGLSFPADLYLEERLKMRKSLGNVVDPITVIGGGKNLGEVPSYGADVLRLWVSSVDYTCDVLIGPQVLRQMSDIYRKIGDNVVPYSDLPMIDQHALFQLENVVQNIKDSFKNYQFFKIFQ